MGSSCWKTESNISYSRVEQFSTCFCGSWADVHMDVSLGACSMCLVSHGNLTVYLARMLLELTTRKVRCCCKKDCVTAAICQYWPLAISVWHEVIYSKQYSWLLYLDLVYTLKTNDKSGEWCLHRFLSTLRMPSISPLATPLLFNGMASPTPPFCPVLCYAGSSTLQGKMGECYHLLHSVREHIQAACVYVIF